MKELSNTQTLAPVKLLSAFLLFSIFKIVLSVAIVILYIATFSV